MRKIGLAIISSMIQALPTVPLQATGYDLATGKPWDHIWLAPWLRNATEDMRVLMRAYRRERALGRQHPEWFNWVKTYVDWLILQQREDGSFPRRWKPGSNEVAEPTGTTSYCPVPLLVMMTEETGDPKYKQAAIRAAEYVWANWGTRGLFVGGASDNPNITDKEAGMLSMEAFLSLYDSTKEPKWLERAKAAADFAESWIWIWNLPMPLDADDAHLHWKKGVPTIGVQGITARVAGSVDEYLDWAVPSYAKLYNVHEGPALPRCRTGSAARHEIHGRSSGTPVRHERHRMAAGRLAHGTGRARPRRRRPPVLAAVDFGQPPVRHHRSGGIRSGPVSTTVQWELDFVNKGNSSSRRFKVPARLVALGIELGQRGRAVAHCGQSQGFLGIGHNLGHDAVRAISQLVDAPELFGTAGKGGNRHNFGVCGGSQCAIRSGDRDLEIGRTGIAANVGDRCDRPLLMRAEHVITHANVDVAGRPVL